MQVAKQATGARERERDGGWRGGKLGGRGAGWLDAFGWRDEEGVPGDILRRHLHESAAVVV